MSRWSKDNEPKIDFDKANQVAFEGTYQCHTCGETVYDAVYLTDLSILTWKCSQGHKSFIENFKVF